VISIVPDHLLDDELKMMAIRAYPAVIYYIKDPSEELQITAMQMDPNVLHMIKNPCLFALLMGRRS
jgi:hypothetical protein